MNSIETHNLKKHFVSNGNIIESVKGIDIVVKRDEIFGFLGPNGAGKTTTMRILTTLLRATSGTALIDGLDVTKNAYNVRKRIGYVSQAGGLDHHATVRENLIFQGRIFGMSKQRAQERAEELITVFQLSDYADRSVKTLSGGQRRRSDIALSIVHTPLVLFLDEPSTGLDPQSRAQVWREIRKVRDLGTTIFLTSHYLDEVDALCDRLAIMDHGKIVAEGTASTLKRQIAGDVLVIGFAEDDHKKRAQHYLQTQHFVRSLHEDAKVLRLYVDQGETILPHVLRAMDQAQVVVQTISLARPTLDDVFLKQTGRSLQTMQQ